MSTEYSVVGDGIPERALRALVPGPDPVWVSDLKGGRFRPASFALTDGEFYLWAAPDADGQVREFWRAGPNRPHRILAFLMDRFGVRLMDDRGVVVSRGDE